MKREITRIHSDDTTPSVESILAAQGIPANAATADRTRDLAEQAISLYSQLAEPSGVVAEIDSGEFVDIYRGEGLNAPSTPLERIVKSAEQFTLFAVTVGAQVTDRITQLFDCREFALGSMLDSAASEGTENTAQWIEDQHVSQLKSRRILETSNGVLRFSPGYCGWHVSAQRKLFGYLKPEDIGIRLTESFLMQPLKSISGVMVLGEKAMFDFEDTYPFCSECVDHSCIERLRLMMKT